MVLHNSKWDRKASRLYRKKHGLAKDSAPKSVGNKSLPETEIGPRPEPEPEPEPEPTVAPIVNTHSGSEDTFDGDPNDSSSSSATEDELPSNSWRYEDQGDYGRF